MSKEIKVNECYGAYSGSPTQALLTNDEGHYVISDLIDLLQEAKKKWGDIPISISDVGFESSHYNDTIGISQVYLYRRKNGDNFCVIESTP